MVTTTIKTYYELLEVSPTASPEVISAAYRAMSKKYHPDLCDLPNAHEIMQQLNVAKDVLLDSEKRKAYDETIRSSPYQHYVQNMKSTFYGEDKGDDEYTIVWVKIEDSYVRLRYLVVYNRLYINFYTKNNRLFDYLKDRVKHYYQFKWDNDLRYWVGPLLNKGLDLLEELGVE